MTTVTEAFAKALAAATVADLEANPDILKGIQSGLIGKRDLENMMLSDVQSGTGVFSNVLKLVRSHDAAGRVGMGQWEAIAGLIGSVASAAVGYSLGRQQISAQTSIAKAAEARIAEQQAQATAQANVQRIAYEQAAATQQAAATGASGSLPSWAIPAGVGVLALGVVIYVATKRK
jgi:hypothetical protein